MRARGHSRLRVAVVQIRLVGRHLIGWFVAAVLSWVSRVSDGRSRLRHKPNLKSAGLIQRKIIPMVFSMITEGTAIDADGLRLGNQMS